ncbi:MAG: allantoinase AllB [Myxococcales bacterium]|nr:allantoinase AllB [Myxococcales bacterium]
MWGLRSQRIIYQGRTQAGILLIEDGKIHDLVQEAPSDVSVEDVGETVVMAGGVDTHVHINEPGRTDWEGFETATRAALLGGMTTLIDMPLNSSPVTTTTAAFAAKQMSYKEKLYAHTGFWAGVIPHHLHELSALLEEGTFGGKAFLCDSGIDEFPAADLETVREALLILKRFDAPLLVHAEIASPVVLPELSQQSYTRYLASRPAQWELTAIQSMIDLCRETGARVHIVHLSTAEALPMLAAAKDEGLPLTVETCPHYLCLQAEEIPDGGTIYKCAPPIRDDANREALWKALGDGLIDFVVSDHSPCPPELKCLDTGDFFKAWGGISSIDLGLSLLWTEAEKRGFGIERIARWLAEAPAQLAQLQHQKGSLDRGRDADLVLWDPEATFTLGMEHLGTRHKCTPYLGKTLRGQVKAAYLKGELAYKDGKWSEHARGEALFATHPSRS